MGHLTDRRIHNMACGAWLALMLLAAVHAAHAHPAGRKLQAVARATAVSTGGTAVAASNSTGSATVDTVAVASRNGTAAAAATGSGNQTVSLIIVADGTNTTTSNSSAPAPTPSSPVAAPSPSAAPLLPATSPTHPTDQPATHVLPLTTVPDEAAPSLPSELPPPPADSAPACTGAPNVTNAVVDGQGRIWGWQNEASCLFYGLPIVDAAAHPALSGSCTGEPSSQSLRDQEGNLYDFEDGVSCMYRPLAMPAALKDEKPPTRKLLQKKDAPAASEAPRSFGEATGCIEVPTADNSAPDSEGRLWGFEGGASCAFRNEEGSPVFYIDYEPGNWVLTPPCATEPFHSSAMMSSKYRIFAWEGGVLCSFKDDQLQPISSDKHYRRLEWADASACSELPTNSTSSIDLLGRLWGFEMDRNCAFKDASGMPLYYEGYAGPKYDPITGGADKEFNYKGYQYVHNTGADTSGEGGPVAAVAVEPEGGFAAAGNDDEGSAAAPIVTVTPAGIIGQKTPDSEETLDAFKEGPTLPASPAAVPLPAAPKPEPAANATKVPAPAATKPEPVVAPITSSTPAGVIGQKTPDAE